LDSFRGSIAGGAEALSREFATGAADSAPCSSSSVASPLQGGDGRADDEAGNCDSSAEAADEAGDVQAAPSQEDMRMQTGGSAPADRQHTISTALEEVGVPPEQARLWALRLLAHGFTVRDVRARLQAASPPPFATGATAMHVHISRERLNALFEMLRAVRVPLGATKRVLGQIVTREGQRQCTPVASTSTAEEVFDDVDIVLW